MVSNRAFPLRLRENAMDIDRRTLAAALGGSAVGAVVGQGTGAAATKSASESTLNSKSQGASEQSDAARKTQLFSGLRPKDFNWIEVPNKNGPPAAWLY